MAVIQDRYEGFLGIVEVYQADGVSPRLDADGNALTTVKAPGAQHPTLMRAKGQPAWFLLAAETGVRSGQLTLRRPRGPRTGWNARTIQIGDLVRFRPEAGVLWAELSVDGVSSLGSTFETFHLMGLVRQILGRPALADGEVKFFGDVPVDDTMGCVDWFMQERFPAVTYPWLKVSPPDPAYLGLSPSIDVVEMKVNDDSTADQVLSDLAELQHGGAVGVWEDRPCFWGIGPDALGGADWFYFHQRPDVCQMVFAHDLAQPSLMGTGLTAANVLVQPGWQWKAYYNVLKVVGGNGLNKTFRDEVAIAAQGLVERYARANVPTVRDEADALRFAEGYFRKFAATRIVYNAFDVVIPNAGALPLPWAGYCKIASNFSENDGDEVTIRSVKVSFEAQPMASIQLGEVERTHPMTSRTGAPWRVGVPLYAADMKRRESEAALGGGGSGGGSSGVIEAHAHLTNKWGIQVTWDGDEPS